MDPSQLILTFAAVSLLLHLLNARVSSPVVAIANRWVRWVLFALGFAYLTGVLGALDRPFWVLAAIGFLGWFLVESVYHWLAIRALSLSPLPLFPRFTLNTSGEEWPTQKRLFWIRDWLRAERFVQVQALKAEIAPGAFLRVSVYQDPAALTRIQIAFLPQPGGAVSLSCSVASRTADDLRFLTDNLHLPFGGFYPENWRVERRPWCRSLPALVARHRERVRRAGVELAEWTTDPLEELNRQQSQLDRLNTDLGFLVPHHERDEHGKLTAEGRYRVWKEIWLLNYLGRSVGY